MEQEDKLLDKPQMEHRSPSNQGHEDLISSSSTE
jgi:hypothetical protein